MKEEARTIYAGGSRYFNESTGQYEYPDGVVSPVPLLPEAITKDSRARSSVKPATPDIMMLNEDSIPVDAMSFLIFENIGGKEIINISRGDIIDGKKTLYQPISNLGEIGRVYSPANLINVSGSLDQYFKNFSIRLELHVPEVGSGPNGENVYLAQSDGSSSTDGDNTDGSIVVELVNMNRNKQVEIQIINSADYMNGIIDYLEEN